MSENRYGMTKVGDLMKRGAEFLSCEYPIICGAMTWVSEPRLVSSVCNSGAFACLAGGNMPPDLLESQINETQSLTNGPFAVNLITIAPAYKKQLDMVCSRKHPIIIFAGSFPRQNEIDKAKKAGAKVLCFASTRSIADRMIRYGADGIILEGSEAGGHIGHVSAMVLLQQILFKFGDKLPVFVAGGIGTGRMMAHVLLMGAAGVQLGTRFVMTHECIAHPNFKLMFKNAQARDAVSTPQYDSSLPVVAVRALRNDAQKEFGQLQLRLLKEISSGKTTRENAQEEVEKFWIGALKKAVIDGDIKKGSVMAGQSVGLADEIKSVKELIAELVADASSEMERLASILGYSFSF